MTRLYREVTARGIPVAKVCEVGVHWPDTANVIDFVEAGTAALLVEPEPRFARAIEERFGGYPGVELLRAAIYGHNGRLRLSSAGASTFVADLPTSPALTNDGYRRDAATEIEVPCRVFGEVDPGDIDVLAVDTEGSEWYVLQSMRSRPAVISLETHGRYYVNPFMAEMSAWLTANGYAPWYKDKSDTVYYRAGALALRPAERLRVLGMRAYLRLRRAKRHLPPLSPT